MSLGTGTTAMDSYVVINLSNLQDGDPDGLALVRNDGMTDTVCEFLSYDGAFTAGNGPANGMMSTDIGVGEPNTAPVGSSLQRQPDGSWIYTEGSNTSGTENECFLEGTQILTDKGYQKVEDLRPGDNVIGQDGRVHLVKWVGIQTMTPEENNSPIQFKAGALGPNIPIKDLFVSPDHAIFVEGLLINAGALVNSITVLQTKMSESFKYYHIELDQHALIVAEGVLAESYLPQREDRDAYDNGAEYEMLYPARK